MTPEELAAAAAAEAAAKAAADKAAADAAAKAASDKAIADKAIADKAVADKALADKAAADAEAARLRGVSDADAALIKEAMKNKEKLKAAADEKAALEAQLKKFEGIDPEKVKALLDTQAKAEAAAAAAEEERLKKAGEFDALKKQIVDQNQAALAEKDKVVQNQNTALDAAMKTINDLTVGASFSNSKFIADELVLPSRVAREVYGANFDVENSNIVAYDKPRGTPGRVKLVDASGNPMEFEAAIKKLVETAPDKDQLLKSKLKNGAASSTTSATGYVSSQQSHEQSGLTGMSRIRAALDKGALKKAAKS